MGLGLGAPAALAQDYPTRPIHLIIPWSAGGPTDVTLRAIAEGASRQLGQPIIIENKAGGAGTVGPATMAATASYVATLIRDEEKALGKLNLLRKP